jgi:hypothetical protein
MKPAILAVDDDPDVLRAVERDLRQIQPVLAQDRCFRGQSKDVPNHVGTDISIW